MRLLRTIWKANEVVKLKNKDYIANLKNKGNDVAKRKNKVE